MDDFIFLIYEETTWQEGQTYSDSLEDFIPSFKASIKISKKEYETYDEANFIKDQLNIEQQKKEQKDPSPFKVKYYVIKRTKKEHQELLEKCK